MRNRGACDYKLICKVKSCLYNNVAVTKLKDVMTSNILNIFGKHHGPLVTVNKAATMNVS